MIFLGRKVMMIFREAQEPITFTGKMGMIYYTVALREILSSVEMVMMNCTGVQARIF